MDEQPIDEQQQSKRRSVLSSLRGMLLTLMILGLLWVCLRYVLAPIVMNNQPSGDSSALEERVAALEKEVSELKAAPVSEAGSSDLSMLQERVQMLENAKPADNAAVIENQTPPAPPIGTAEVERLKADVEELKKTDHAYVRSIILINQLQDALREGRPYGSELTALKTLRPEMNEKLEPIAPFVILGVPTYASLKREFKASIDKALNVKTDEKSFRDNLRGLVKIRKIGQQTGSDDQSIIARADARLEEMNLVEAVKELESLSEPAKKAFEPFLAHAKAHLTAQDVMNHLNAQLADKIAP